MPEKQRRFCSLVGATVRNRVDDPSDIRDQGRGLPFGAVVAGAGALDLLESQSHGLTNRSGRGGIVVSGILILSVFFTRCPSTSAIRSSSGHLFAAKFFFNDLGADIIEGDHDEAIGERYLIEK